MSIHLRNPDKEMEKTIRFVRNHTTNLVACLTNHGMVDDGTAWEIAIEGIFDAMARRIAAEDDPDKVAASFAQSLCDRVAAIKIRLARTA